MSPNRNEFHETIESDITQNAHVISQLNHQATWESQQEVCTSDDMNHAMSSSTLEPIAS